jgi:alpha-L-arabinofuranosidase
MYPARVHFSTIYLLLSLIVLLLTEVQSLRSELQPSGLQATSSDEKISRALIHNGDFESKLGHWTTHVFGASPRIEFDAEIKHGGSQALKVSCDELTDTAFGQELKLRPNQWYLFSGWVRTTKLKPHDASVHATYQIQFPGGQNVIATGSNQSGDNEWCKVTIAFQAPKDGLVRIAPFFMGYGKGTGTAWFDDLSLSEVDLHQSPIRITSNRLNNATISPFQYGQFIEYLCDSVPAIWAEKLYDGSFEGLSPYHVFYIKETDFREKPWYPSGATNRAKFSFDTKSFISGKQAKSITVSENVTASVGISQDGLSLVKDEPTIFSCYLQNEGLTEPVKIQLHHEGKIIAESTITTTSEWKKYSLKLIPALTDHNATLSIHINGPGKLLLDNVSLMPEKTIGGWRPDAVEALRALKPGIIRFGGSILEGEFDWKFTIGDPDRRTPFQAWGGLQPMGPGLEEFVQLCREVNAEPLICVATVNREPKVAADQVEYFNGSTDTPMGKLRAKNGHPKPYNIKYWQIGNEQTGEKYESQIVPFANAMRKVDPNIKLLSGFPTEGIIKNSAPIMDYICPHQYSCADITGVENEIKSTRELIRKYAPSRNIKLAVTEWNTTGSDFGPGRTKLLTLENALDVARYHNLMHRYSDFIEITNRSNLSNSFCSGIIQTDNHRLYKTPAYSAQYLYVNLAGNRALKIDSVTPPTAGLDLSATLSEDHATVTLFAVNRSSESVKRPVDFTAFGNGSQQLDVWTLADSKKSLEPDATNSFGEPERVAIAESRFPVTSAEFQYQFAPYSLTVLQWKVKK